MRFLSLKLEAEVGLISRLASIGIQMSYSFPSLNLNLSIIRLSRLIFLLCFFVQQDLVAVISFVNICALFWLLLRRLLDLGLFALWLFIFQYFLHTLLHTFIQACVSTANELLQFVDESLSALFVLHGRRWCTSSH